MTEEDALVEAVRERFQMLVRLGADEGAAPMAAVVAELDDDEVRFLLLTALGFFITQARRVAAAGRLN